MDEKRIQSILDDFLFDPDRDEESEGSDPDIALSDWRRRIDAIDRFVVHLLNERSRCANKIGHIKRDLGLPIYVPSREEEVIRHTLSSNRGPLPDEAVRHVFERIIDETRSLERRKYQDESGDNGESSDGS